MGSVYVVWTSLSRSVWAKTRLNHWVVNRPGGGTRGRDVPCPPWTLGTPPTREGGPTDTHYPPPGSKIKKKDCNRLQNVCQPPKGLPTSRTPPGTGRFHTGNVANRTRVFVACCVTAYFLGVKLGIQKSAACFGGPKHQVPVFHPWRMVKIHTQRANVSAVQKPRPSPEKKNQKVRNLRNCAHEHEKA